MSDELVEKYGGIKVKMACEGSDYYVTEYESTATFDFDPELQQAFVNAQTSYNLFLDLIDRRIIDNGGDPHEWEY